MNNTNFLKIPTSVGELIDKISILEVKKSKVVDKKKLEYINDELNLLNEIASSLLKENQTIKKLTELVKVNSELWDIEDEIRNFERDKIFDSRFIEVARKIYKLNDYRFELKNEVNQIYNSQIREVKNYNKY